MYTVSKKKLSQNVFVTSSKKLDDFDKICHKNVNVSHLTWVVSQHYLVKLKGRFCVEILMLENKKVDKFYKY